MGEEPERRKARKYINLAGGPEGGAFKGTESGSGGGREGGERWVGKSGGGEVKKSWWL